MASLTSGSARRTIALVAAIGFFVWGVILVVQGVSATGAIDIQSAVVSGKIQTGSAGLIVLFIAAVIIIFAIASGDDADANQKLRSAPSSDGQTSVFHISRNTKRAAWILAALLLVLLGCVLLLASVRGQPEYTGALVVVTTVLGMAAVVVFVGLLFLLAAEFE